MGLCLAALAGTPAGAQVTSVDVIPASVTIPVGARAELLASAYDARGGLVQDAQYRWTSSDPTIARVEPEPALPSVAYVIGVAVGVTTVEVRVGTVTKAVAVVVQGPQPVPQPPPPVVPQRQPDLPDTVMAAGVESRAMAAAARVRAFPFQSAPSCASAFVVGGGLVLTTYRAIRGADRVELEWAGRTLSEVQVAAYSVPNDLAVLRVTGPASTDSLPLASRVVDQQVVWAFGHPNCGAAESQRLRISGHAAGTASVRLSSSLPATFRGAPLVTQQGQVVAVAAADASAIAAPVAQDVTSEARTNLRLRALLTPDQVGRRENHLYGSLAITSGVAGTVARVTPLEAWQWAEAAAEGATPFTFTGPMGRYRIELVQNGQVRATTEAAVRPGELQPVTLTLPVAQAPGPAPARPVAQASAGGGGGFPVALVVLGVAAAGAGGYFLLAKGDETSSETCPSGTTGTPPNCTPITSGGSVRIRVPNP